MEDLTIQDIFMVLRRRKKHFLLAASIVLVLGMIFALRWSNYRSIATVQVEQSYVSSNVTTPSGMNNSDTIMALVDQRISQIQQKVTGQDSLADIINKFNLYPGARDAVPVAVLADKMRKNIKLQLISSTISNPAAAMKQTAEQLSAIAFTISFDYNEPQLAQQVVGELITRFLDEDLKLRRTLAQETSAFLAKQISQLETTMAEQEKVMAEFRAEHGESGQAALMFNQQANMTTSLSLQSLESQITANEGNQGNLRAQLATLEPYTRVIADGQVLTTPAIQLKALEAQYAQLSAQYGPQHPDIIKTRNQIASLKAQLGTSDNTEQLQAKITDIETNLAAAEKTYGSKHPDVLSLQRQLEKLKERKEKASSASINELVKKDADNPAYLQVVAQLRSSEEQHKSLVEQRESLTKQKMKYEQMIAGNPGIEQQMSKLSRDYDNAQLRYRELKEKKMSADMLEQLEVGRKGQRLVVTNPPAIPDSTQPVRSLLMLGALALSLLSGLGVVTLLELTTQSVRSVNHIAAIVGVMPLVYVPYLQNTDIKKSIRQFRSAMISIISGLYRIAYSIMAAITNKVKSIRQ